MMNHDEILARLYAQKRLDFGAEVRRDRIGMDLRRASRLDRSTFWRRLMSRSSNPLIWFGKRAPSPLHDGVTKVGSGKTAATPN
jgi:hypothetical protein